MDEVAAGYWNAGALVRRNKAEGEGLRFFLIFSNRRVNLVFKCCLKTISRSCACDTVRMPDWLTSLTCAVVIHLSCPQLTRLAPIPLPLFHEQIWWQWGVECKEKGKWKTSMGRKTDWQMCIHNNNNNNNNNMSWNGMVSWQTQF